MAKVKYSQDIDTLLIELSIKPVEYAKEAGQFIVHFDKEGEPVILEIQDAKNFLMGSLYSLMEGTETEEKESFIEDMLAATSPEYLESIKEAREDYRNHRVFSHEEVFGKEP